MIQRFVVNQFGDEYLATIGTKVTKKGVVVSHEGNDVRRVVDMLAEVDKLTKTADDVSQNRLRRMTWVRALG